MACGSVADRHEFLTDRRDVVATDPVDGTDLRDFVAGGLVGHRVDLGSPCGLEGAVPFLGLQECATFGGYLEPAGGEVLAVLDRRAVGHDEVRIVCLARGQEDRADLAVTVRHDHEAATAPDAARSVERTASPVAPVLTSIDHDDHPGGTKGQPHRGIGERRGRDHRLNESQRSDRTAPPDRRYVRGLWTNAVASSARSPRRPRNAMAARAAGSWLIVNT